MQIHIVQLGFLAYIAIAVIWGGAAYVVGRAASSPGQAEDNVREKCAKYRIKDGG